GRTNAGTKLRCSAALVSPRDADNVAAGAGGDEVHGDARPVVALAGPHRRQLDHAIPRRRSDGDARATVAAAAALHADDGAALARGIVGRVAAAEPRAHPPVGEAEALALDAEVVERRHARKAVARDDVAPPRQRLEQVVRRLLPVLAGGDGAAQLVVGD